MASSICLVVTNSTNFQSVVTNNLRHMQCISKIYGNSTAFRKGTSDQLSPPLKKKTERWPSTDSLDRAIDAFSSNLAEKKICKSLLQ